MPTRIVRDIRGCAEELAELVDRVELQEGEKLLTCGELIDRGSEPVGVIHDPQRASAPHKSVAKA